MTPVKFTQSTANYMVKKYNFLVVFFKKWPLYCPQGSGMLRQQLLMMRGIAWYCMVLHEIA